MIKQSRILKWGNGLGLKLDDELLDVAEMSLGSKVNVEAGNGRLVIQLSELNHELTLDELLSKEPGMEELISELQSKLKGAIEKTNANAEKCKRLVDEFEKKGF